MKNKVTIFTTAIILLLQFQMLKAQNNCEALKKENESLKKALQITTPTQTINSSKIDFNLIKCIGNKKDQSVELILNLVNHDVNQRFQFEVAKAIDIEANEYKTFEIKIGSGSISNKIYTDVPVKTIIKYTKVLPAITIFRSIPISFYYGEPGHTKEIEYKNIEIDWQ